MAETGHNANRFANARKAFLLSMQEAHTLIELIDGARESLAEVATVEDGPDATMELLDTLRSTLDTRWPVDTDAPMHVPATGAITPMRQAR